MANTRWTLGDLLYTQILLVAGPVHACIRLFRPRRPSWTASTVYRVLHQPLHDRQRSVILPRATIESVPGESGHQHRWSIDASQRSDGDPLQKAEHEVQVRTMAVHQRARSL